MREFHVKQGVRSQRGMVDLKSNCSIKYELLCMPIFCGAFLRELPLLLTRNFEEVSNAVIQRLTVFCCPCSLSITNSFLFATSTAALSTSFITFLIIQSIFPALFIAGRSFPLSIRYGGTFFVLSPQYHLKIRVSRVSTGNL